MPSVLAIVLLVVTAAVAISIRYGVAGRRISALVIIGLVALTPQPLGSPKVNGDQAWAITTLRATNAAQLMYLTSIGSGSYADSFDELTRAGLFTPRDGLRFHYELRLIKQGEYYAATAVPLVRDRQSGPIRSFCVDDRGSIFQTLGGTTPEIDSDGRCRDASKPIR